MFSHKSLSMATACMMFLGTLGLSAQAPAPIVQMEFDAVIKQALDKNTDIARAVTTITRAETLLQQARAVTLPIVTTTVTNNTLDNARGFAGGITQPQNQFAFTASAASVL